MSVKPLLNRTFNDEIDDSDRFKDTSQFIYQKNSILFKEFCKNAIFSTDSNAAQSDKKNYTTEKNINKTKNESTICVII